MISYKQACLKLLKNKIKIDNEKIKSDEACNRISATDIISPTNYPSSNNAAFDGFAINSSETNKLNNKNSKKFRILKTIAAGKNPNLKKIPKFSTIEIMTGAIVPYPFDTIIPIEKIVFDKSSIKKKYILIKNQIKKNNHVRFLGSDFKKGDIILNKGELITPQHILAFKTLGITSVFVKKKPKIVFYSTGNELSNNIKIPAWKVRSSNSFYIKSLLKNLPIQIIEKKILRDNHSKVFEKEIIRNLKSDNDIIITSGAVSAGKYDFIPNIIKKFKLKSYFKGAYIRPGKPIVFAKFKKNNKVFFGLPGNPISSAACFRFFVLPYIYFAIDYKNSKPIFAKITNKFIKQKKFTRFIKGKLNFTKKGIVEFTVNKGQESYKIKPFTKSNVWGLFPSGKEKFKKGDFIECYTLTGIN